MKWIKRSNGGFQQFKAYLTRKYTDIGLSKPAITMLVNREMPFDIYEALNTKPISLFHSPYEITNLSKAAESIYSMVKEKREIHIFADYDVDGLMAGYIMSSYLKRHHDNIIVYYPERKEGYGLSETYVKNKCPEGCGIITVDNGISANNAIELAKRKKIKVVVTDHHQPKEKVPDCVICDPYLGDRGHYLCGASVAWKVCQALDELFGCTMAWEYISYAAIGTLGDVMPMTYENMAIVTEGLKMVNERYIPNISYYLDSCDINHPTSKDILWTLVPALNACGRMGNVQLAASLLTCENAKDRDDIIFRIKNTNDSRKKIQNIIIKDAMQHDYENDAFCLYDSTKHGINSLGLAGIVASKLSDVYGKPAIVYIQNEAGECRGSARAAKIDILSYLKQEKKLRHIYDCGGHAHACAVTLIPEAIDSFKHSLNGHMRNAVLDSQQDEATLFYDDEISYDDLNTKTVQNLSSMLYDKYNFESPNFIICNLKVIHIRISGNNKNNIMLSLKDKNGRVLDFWCFGIGELYRNLGCPTNVDVYGYIDIMGFGRDKNRPTLKITNIRCHKES